jgi:hypothetical protein
MKLQTLDKGEITISKKTIFTEVSQSYHASHWGWWILWLILFWPACALLAIMALCRKKYTVIINNSGCKTMCNLDQTNYSMLRFMLNIAEE